MPMSRLKQISLLVIGYYLIGLKSQNSDAAANKCQIPMILLQNTTYKGNYILNLNESLIFECISGFIHKTEKVQNPSEKIWCNTKGFITPTSESPLCVERLIFC